MARVDKWLLVLVAAVLVLAMPLIRSALPPKYFYDSLKIQQVAAGIARYEEDRAFTVTGGLYRWLGLESSPAAVAVLSMLLCYGVVVLAWRDTRYVTRAQFVLACLYLLFAAVYLSSYSKDVFVLLLVAVLLTAPRGLAGEVLIVGAMLGYAYVVREYWFLVAAAYIAARRVFRGPFRPRTVLVFLVVVTAVCAVAFLVGQGVELDHFRGVVNEDRGSADAETAIAVSVGGGLVGSALSCLLVLVTLLLPVPLLLTGNPLHAAFFVLIVTMWVLVGRGIRSRLRDGSGAQGDIRWVRCFSLVVSFVLVQSFFEPDYGSYLRHLSPILPVAIYVAGRPAGDRGPSQESAAVRHPKVA
ncbi:hypothetical protein JD79_00978 [Geodermatophilus normandii]|uniref:Uncharacterized protein n=1 Tax=Geodermatophilus normandii TaxID=1137989 RepID=A0A317QGD2_9ACTN|nr:hypothetical protein [Geodermatophilus normandii]PWW21837.1 hypothetical protein JD79_00978 [Geodermatophilus normandii]